MNFAMMSILTWDLNHLLRKSISGWWGRLNLLWHSRVYLVAYFKSHHLGNGLRAAFLHFNII